MNAKRIRRQVTERWLGEMDKIVGRQTGVKITQAFFAEEMGLTSPIISRMRKVKDNYVSIEAMHLICKKYKVDPEYLLLGKKKVIKNV